MMQTVEQLRAQLKEYAAQIERIHQLNAMEDALRAELSDIANKKRDLLEILQRENADVTRLERVSASSVFYALLGKKEEKLDKERQEAYAAQLKYRAAEQQYNDCLSRVDLLATKKKGLLQFKTAYSETFDAIKAQLHEDLAYAEALERLERQLGELTAQLHEVDEALTVGKSCQRQIAQIERDLESASNYATWDMLGGSFIVDHAKHACLDEAQTGVHQLQSSLSRFRTELADVRVDANFAPVQVDSALRFADYFFDDLISNWTVRNHIESSQDSVCQVRYQVSDALFHLEQTREKLLKEQARLEDARAALVRGA